MTVYGVTPEGFVAKPLEQILANIEERQRAEISAALNTSTETPIGQLNGIFASALRELWELAQAAFDAFDPANASGDQLTALAALTGTTRRAATRSTVTATVTLAATTTLPAGSEAHVSGDPASRFRTIADVTSVGAGAYAAEMESVEPGPVAANAGTLTVIATPVAGWSAVTNAADAIPGEPDESDAALRARREAELRAIGSSPLDAIRAELLKVDGVEAVVMFENVTMAVDANGLPPKSIEAVVLYPDSPATEQAVADTLWASKAGGIETFGSTTVTVQDAAGVDHEVEFTRPTKRDVYVVATVTVDKAVWSSVPEAQEAIRDAIVASEAWLSIGRDVIAARLRAAVFNVSGVIDITALTLGFAPAPAGTANLTVGAREYADLDTGRTSVTATLTSPP